jgi:hypothetical protein
MYPGFMIEFARQQMRERRHEHRHPEDASAALISLRVKRTARRETS